jgi:hypothetical protein
MRRQENSFWRWIHTTHLRVVASVTKYSARLRWPTNCPSWQTRLLADLPKHPPRSLHLRHYNRNHRDTVKVWNRRGSLCLGWYGQCHGKTKLDGHVASFFIRLLFHESWNSKLMMIDSKDLCTTSVCGVGKIGWTRCLILHPFVIS